MSSPDFVATLVADPARPTLSDAFVERAAQALPGFVCCRWLDPGIAVDLFFDGAGARPLLAPLAAEAEALGPRAPPLLFVGGTGLYFRALTRGLSEIPAVPDEVRVKIRAQAEGAPTPELHAHLANTDPLTASRLR